MECAHVTSSKQAKEAVSLRRYCVSSWRGPSSTRWLAAAPFPGVVCVVASGCDPGVAAGVVVTFTVTVGA